MIDLIHRPPVRPATVRELRAYARGSRRPGVGAGRRFGGGGGGAAGDTDALILPESSGTLEVFYRLDDASTSGGVVDQINDKSGNARHLTATLTARPTYNASGLNGQPTCTFDGSNDYMVSPSFSLTQPITRFAVLRNVTWTSADRICDGNTANELALSQFTGSDNFTIYAGSSFVCAVSPGGTGFGALVSVYSGAASQQWWNRGTASGAANPGAGGLSTGLQIGRNSAGSSAYANFELAEMRYYSGALSTADREYLEDYAASRYGITLT